MAGNRNLNSAAKAKNDEFYTQKSDIENELKHYKQFFRDKVVFCNCDDPYESYFFKYFADKFNIFGLKKLIATNYVGSPIFQQELNFEGTPNEFPDFDAKKQAVKVEITEIPYDEVKGFSMADLEFLLTNKKNILTRLEGDGKFPAGDFRSKECVECLKEADIVVTNPPFSLFREYVAQLIQYDKKFVILGNKNAITYKEIFPLIMQNKMWLGYTPMSRDLLFTVPKTAEEILIATEKNGSKYRIVDGKVFARSQAIWFTNLYVKRFEETLPLYCSYYKNPENYPHYDNYDAIEVSKTAEIPGDYEGVMGVPITFLDKYNPKQFEIVGIAKRGAGDPALKTKVYEKKDYANYSDLNAGPVLIKDGIPKNTYPRILIRRRTN